MKIEQTQVKWSKWDLSHPSTSFHTRSDYCGRPPKWGRINQLHQQAPSLLQQVTTPCRSQAGTESFQWTSWISLTNTLLLVVAYWLVGCWFVVGWWLGVSPLRFGWRQAVQWSHLIRQRLVDLVHPDLLLSYRGEICREDMPRASESLWVVAKCCDFNRSVHFINYP